MPGIKQYTFAVLLVLFASHSYAGIEPSKNTTGKEICPVVIRLAILPFNEVIRDAQSGYNRSIVIDNIHDAIRNLYVNYRTVAIRGSCYKDWYAENIVDCQPAISAAFWKKNRINPDVALEVVEMMDADIGISYSISATKMEASFCCYLVDLQQRKVYRYCESEESMTTQFRSYGSIKRLTQKALSNYLRR